MAHIGGFIAGFLYATLLSLTGIEKRVINPRLRNKRVKKGVSKDPRFVEACNLVREGATSRAKAIFNSLIREYPFDIEMIEDIALIYRENGMMREFKELTEKNVKFLMLNGRYEEAASIMLNFHVEISKIARPQQIFRVARWLSEKERFQDAYMLYRSIIESGEADINIIGKAYTEIITILVWKMNRVKEAIQLCEEWKKLPSDQYWKGQISMIEEKIAEVVGMSTAGS